MAWEWYLTRYFLKRTIELLGWDSTRSAVDPCNRVPVTLKGHFIHGADASFTTKAVAAVSVFKKGRSA